jgi:hypothetical protein
MNSIHCQAGIDFKLFLPNVMLTCIDPDSDYESQVKEEYAGSQRQRRGGMVPRI